MASAPAMPPRSDVLLRLFASRGGRALRVCAPMVDQSELPFRMLTRRHGADLCYTPMLHARLAVESREYLPKHFTTCAADRPLVVQFCGNDPATLLAAGLRVQDRCDGIDINLGCPQGIAKRGNYGAFLLPVEPLGSPAATAKTALLVSIVRALAGVPERPVTCKIRLLPTAEATLALVLALQAAGCAVLTVHGRQRGSLKERVGQCDWEAIRALATHPEVRMPIIANGGVACFEDVAACAEATAAAGIMASEALLEDPALFARSATAALMGGGAAAAGGSGAARAAPPAEGPATPPAPDVFQLAEEYCDLVAQHGGADAGCVRAHVIKILFGALEAFPDLRDELVGRGALAGGPGPALRVAQAARARAARAAAPLPPGVWEALARGLMLGAPAGRPASVWAALDLAPAQALAGAQAGAQAGVQAAAAGEGEGGPRALPPRGASAAALEQALASSLAEAGAGAGAEADARGAPPASSPAEAAACGAPPRAEPPPTRSSSAAAGLARTALLWRAARAAHPACGLSHPAYLWDLRAPGAWYMRHRRAAFGVAKPLRARRALEGAPPEADLAMVITDGGCAGAAGEAPCGAGTASDAGASACDGGEGATPGAGDAQPPGAGDAPPAAQQGPQPPTFALSTLSELLEAFETSLLPPPPAVGQAGGKRMREGA